MTQRLIFLNSHRAKSGTVDGRPLRPEYMLLAHFFGCGAVDRTRTLDIGVDYEVLQEIPTSRTEASFAEICDAVADSIIDEAQRLDLPIQVAWSGGIDSTVALISLTRRLRARKDLDRLIVCLSIDSIYEYPRFYEQFIMDTLRTRPMPTPLPTMLAEEMITVTGEHGDQLFGSDHLEKLVKGGAAQLPYRHVVPFYMSSRLTTSEQAERLMAYLAPQIERAPVPIETAFDYLWWCNFSLKWQQVNLRIPAFRQGRIGMLYRRTRHFFADERFQAWSLSRPDLRKVTDWRAYKLEAKKVILDATGDFDYFATKEKAPSLKRVLVDRARQGNDRYLVHIYEDFEVHFEVGRKRKQPLETIDTCNMAE